MSTTVRSTRYPNVRWRGDVLYYRHIDAMGKRVETKYGQGTPKQAHLAQLAKQEEADAVKSGLIDTRQVGHMEYLNAPISKDQVPDPRKGQQKPDGPLETYFAHLEHVKRVSPAYLKECKRYLRLAIKEMGIKSLGDFDPSRVNTWLNQDHDWSANTRNVARTTVVAFPTWAHNYGKIGFNPLPPKLIPKADGEADRRRHSREFKPDLFWQLIDALTAPQPTRKGRGGDRRLARCGPVRAAFYVVAANTGLRWAEIGRLEWGMFDLRFGTVEVPAGMYGEYFTKNKKKAMLPLHDRVVEHLKRIKPKDAESTDKVFKSVPRLRTWKEDLVRAGVAEWIYNKKGEKVDLKGYRDHRGHQIDRKSLRMTFCTWLRDNKTPLEDAQKLMRHSDPKLTSNIYQDAPVDHLRGALHGNSGRRTPHPDATQMGQYGGKIG